MIARLLPRCRTRRAVLSTVLALSLAQSAAGQPAPHDIGDPADVLPARLARVSIVQQLDAQLPLDAVFRTSTGMERPLGALFAGRPVVLAFAYYECPLLCPFALRQLVHALRAIDVTAGREFDVIVVSFDPADTREAAAARQAEAVADYGREGAAAGFHFLTGDRASIEVLTTAAGFAYDYDAERGEFLHASGVMVATPDGRLSRYLLGADYPPRDLTLALVEAADGRIGSLFDRALLYCYRYDPTRGRYSALTFRLLRISAAATVLALAAFIGGSWWQQRRRGPGTA